LRLPLVTELIRENWTTSTSCGISRHQTLQVSLDGGVELLILEGGELVESGGWAVLFCFFCLIILAFSLYMIMAATAGQGFWWETKALNKPKFWDFYVGFQMNRSILQNL